MPQATLRILAGQPSPSDITVEIQQETADYLARLTFTKKARVSTYLQRDWDHVDTSYAELFVADGNFRNLIKRVTPGSRSRKVRLPGPMKQGEQLTLEIERQALSETRSIP